MLELRNITKSFGDFKALDNLSMTVPEGTVYGLVGPNGAGKSTAIRCMVGVYRPDCGEVLMEGAGVYENPTLKTRIGYIPDIFSISPPPHWRKCAASIKESIRILMTLSLSGFMTSSICPAKHPSAASPRACRSRPPSICPFAAGPMC